MAACVRGAGGILEPGPRSVRPAEIRPSTSCDKPDSCLNGLALRTQSMTSDDSGAIPLKTAFRPLPAGPAIPCWMRSEPDCRHRWHSARAPDPGDGQPGRTDDGRAGCAPESSAPHDRSHPVETPSGRSHRPFFSRFPLVPQLAAPIIEMRKGNTGVRPAVVRILEHPGSRKGLPAARHNAPPRECGHHRSPSVAWRFATDRRYAVDYL